MNKIVLRMIVLLLLPTAGYSSPAYQPVQEEIWADDGAFLALDLDEESADFFCRKPKNFLGDLASTISKGVVDVSSKLYETAKKVAPHLKNGIGTVAHLANAGLDKIDPNALAAILKAASDVAVVSAPILGSLIGVEIPTGALEKLSLYTTPDNVALALAMAKGLTGATEAVFYRDPNAEKDPTTVEKAGEVVKNAAETVKVLSQYLLDNKGKISKNEENEVKQAIQEGLKIMEQVR